ncbi:MAG: TRAP transporter small permease subunit [Gammaproteobacteria bacterium]|jgi:TRAP-type C4-dicarboxylate transport system permease small subunit
MNSDRAHSVLHRIHSALVQVENWILVFTLFSMILIAVMQILLRNFFGFGIIWAETLVRMLVLWTALIGAMVATRQSKHINIDIITRFASERGRTVINALANLFTAIVCLVVMYYSVVFVALEYEDGSPAFANVPNWLCEAIIPFAFLIMGGRYVIAFAVNIVHITRKTA